MKTGKALAISLISRVRASAPPKLLGLLGRPDLSTSEGRALARHRQILAGAIMTALVRGVGILTAIVTVPLTLHYLGAERFGMWATISSFSALLSFSDFGIGNGVLTAVARHSGRGDFDGLRRYVSTGYASLAVICSALIGFAVASPLIFDWSDAFSVRTILARSEATMSAVAFICLFALTNLLGVIGRVQTGLQQQWRNGMWLLMGNIGAFVALLLAIHVKASLPWLVVALVGTPLIFLVGNTVFFFLHARPDLIPSWASVDWATMRSLLTSGLLFMLLQFCVAIVAQSNNLIIAQVLGAAKVASFAVPDRMFSFASLMMSFFLTPLWAAYGEATTRGDGHWVRRTFIQSILLTLGVMGPINLMMYLAGPRLLHLWLGGAVTVPAGLLGALAIWRVIESINNATAVLLNSANRLIIQALAGVLSALTVVLLRVWLVNLFGVVGVVIGGIAAYSLVQAPIILFGVLKVLRELSTEARQT